MNQLYAIHSHSIACCGAGFSPDGRSLASGDLAGNIWVTDEKDYSPEHTSTVKLTKINSLLLPSCLSQSIFMYLYISPRKYEWLFITLTSSSLGKMLVLSSLEPGTKLPNPTYHACSCISDGTLINGNGTLEPIQFATKLISMLVMTS